MSIINLLNQIKNEEIALPAIQRDFVWPQDKSPSAPRFDHAGLAYDFFSFVSGP